MPRKPPFPSGKPIVAQQQSGDQRPRQTVQYDDIVRSAFAELVQPGRLLFNPPDRMQLGHTERVEVRLTRTLKLDTELLGTSADTVNPRWRRSRPRR